MLLGLLGELEKFSGSLEVKGKIAYVGKKPWIFAGSIKQNILFGNVFNKEKLDRVIEACGLKKVVFSDIILKKSLFIKKNMNLKGH